MAKRAPKPPKAEVPEPVRRAQAAALRTLEILAGSPKNVSLAEMFELLEGAGTLDGCHQPLYPHPEGRALFERWVARGDGIACYQASVAGAQSPDCRYRSFGSAEATIPLEVPPLEDPCGAGAATGRVYTLVAVYHPRGPVLLPKK